MNIKIMKELNITNQTVNLRQSSIIDDDQDLNVDFIHKRKIKLKTPPTIDKQER
jgi:hypothetical protein